MLYRLLTGLDDSAFCHKVSKALSEGWELYGEPRYVFDAEVGQMRCAQAVTKTNGKPYVDGMKLSEG